jgi:anti-anti-sigma factor
MGPARTTFDTHVDNDTATLKVIGDTAARDRVAPLRNTVSDLVRAGARTVVVDLSTARWVGAAMLGELVGAQETVTQAGGRMRLAGLTRRTKRALAAAHLDAVFKTAGVQQA